MMAAAFRLQLLLLCLLLPGMGQAAPDPADVFHRAVAAMQAGEYAEAEVGFRRVIQLDPGSAPAYINLGVTLMRERRWEDALVPLRKAQTLGQPQAGLLLNIGLAYYRMNQFAAAVAPFAQSLAANPQSSQARYLLGLCYFFTSQYKPAADTLAPLWEHESGNPNYLYVLSIAAGKAHQEALDQQATARLVAVGQNAPEFHLYIGKASLAKGDRDQAIVQFRLAEAARPNLPLVHYFLGRAYLEQHDYAQAESELRADIAIEPAFAYSYEDLGLMYAERDQPVKAEQAFHQALEREKTLANSWLGLGKLYRQAGRNRDALTMLDHAVALAPNSASIHYARGQVLARLGKAEAARAEFAVSGKLLKTFNDQLQQDLSGDRAADAQAAAQQ